MTDSSPNSPRTIDRRNLVKGAAWSVPVIALVTAAPFASASTVGNFSVDGSCAVLGLIGPGFVVTAGAQPLPIGTRIDIVGQGGVNIGVFSVTGGTASVNVLSQSASRITLTAPLAANQTLALRSTLSVSVAFRFTATATLPTGFTAGPTAKPSGSVSTLLVLCSAD
ncbi:hypothetical protein C5E10_03765 [Pseudoclavibacter sp. RFBG4]|uniref:hypothetical protein n=1 Tax=Pseudoclavibacter sp. RFBG4 TaxID=2080575 RepID=UPI000CE81CEE|nr:hypothetical protein [Pseudoclavibacter sp. RFBG4]PPG35536.1 hypothetical protein C5E10_03765 [Pseudoclavibacter sp. RFBG4]